MLKNTHLSEGKKKKKKKEKTCIAYSSIYEKNYSCKYLEKDRNQSHKRGKNLFQCKHIVPEKRPEDPGQCL